jgi:hypothetical protein
MIVSYDGTGMSRLLSIIGIVFLGIAAYTLFREPARRDRLIGSFAGFVTCVVASLLTLERSRFELDPRVRSITWRRRWGWSVREGITTFDRVRAVVVQTPIGDDGVPSLRLALLLVEGGEVPLTMGYGPDPSGELPELGDRLRGMLGLEQHVGLAGHLQQLVNQGKSIEAIKIIRQKGDVSLEEAKRRVDELRERRKSA